MRERERRCSVHMKYGEKKRERERENTMHREHLLYYYNRSPDRDSGHWYRKSRRFACERRNQLRAAGTDSKSLFHDYLTVSFQNFMFVFAA